VPRGWTEEQAEEYHALWKSLRGLEGLPAPGAMEAEPLRNSTMRVVETCPVTEPERPPLRLQLTWYPRANSLKLDYAEQIGTFEVLVDEANCVLLGADDLEIVRFVQKHWPGTALRVWYAPSAEDERDRPPPRHLIDRARRGESL
jgi:hypothetical protein